MEPEEYFTTIYVLLCDSQKLVHSPQPFFPAEYLPNGLELTGKVRSRRA
jgi:hypothetical protein